MKRFFQYIGLFVGITMLLCGCKSDAEETTMSQKGDCVLMATATEADITLDNYQTTVLQLGWQTPLWYSNADSRKSVHNTLATYIQMAADPAFSVFSETLANGESITYTAGNLNTFAKRLGMTVGQQGSLYFRIRCGNLDTYSNVCAVKVTPIYVNMSLMDVLNGEKTDTISKLHSPAENGVYTGMMYATAWMNCWFAEADGTIWGNNPVSNTEFVLSADNPWNCWFPEAKGDFYVTVNTPKKYWSAAHIDTLRVNGKAMVYNQDEQKWQQLVELDGSTTLTFQADALLFSTTSRTDAKKAEAITLDFTVSGDTLRVGDKSEAPTSGTGTHTVSVTMTKDGYYRYKVEAGNKMPEEKKPVVVPKPNELKIYDKDKTAELVTLTKNTAGNYVGSLTAEWGWFNFMIYDAENNIWYGSDPEDKTKLSSAEGYYSLWIDSEQTGIYAIEVNLNTMKWTATKTGDLPPVLPAELYLYGDPDWSTATATLAKVGDTATYSCEVTVSTDGNFKIVEGNTWYGLDPEDNTKLSAAEGNWNIWLAAGTYTITVDWSTMTFTATPKTE